MTGKQKLDRSWEYCLAMWKWISEHLPRGFTKLNRSDKHDVLIKLKVQWLTENGFGGSRTLMNCFFCDFSSNGSGSILCSGCPGRLADPDFHCNHCSDSINWVLNPKKFYKNLVKMNKKRLEG